jgi:hypothetical protein
MALAALGAAAVLDVGSNAAQAAPSASPFAGNWSGTWFIAANGAGGDFDWTISDVGRIDGTLTHTGRPDGDGDMVGRVSADGEIVFVGMVPDETHGNEWGNGYPFKGTAEIDEDDKLVVTVTLAASPFANPLVAVLERK